MNMTEQAAIIYKEMTDMAEDNAAAWPQEMRDMEILLCIETLDKLAVNAKYIQFKIHLLSTRHDSMNLKEAYNIAGDLVLDLKGAIQDIKGDK